MKLNFLSELYINLFSTHILTARAFFALEHNSTTTTIITIKPLDGTSKNLQSKEEHKDQESHLTQDTTWKVTKTQENITYDLIQESQEVSPFPSR